jgi:hypothetical protein
MGRQDTVGEANGLEGLTPTRTALLVVDMQRYFVHPHHAFGRAMTMIQPEGSALYFERLASGTLTRSLWKMHVRFRRRTAINRRSMG